MVGIDSIAICCRPDECQLGESSLTLRHRPAVSAWFPQYLNAADGEAGRAGHTRFLCGFILQIAVFWAHGSVE
jgi:hypothetical protein